jgi:hypothetical protein
MGIRDRFFMYRIAMACGGIGALGIIVLYVSLRKLELPQPPFHLLPLAFVGDLYCLGLIGWILRREEKKVHRAGSDIIAREQRR